MREGNEWDLSVFCLRVRQCKNARGTSERLVLESCQSMTLLFAADVMVRKSRHDICKELDAPNLADAQVTEPIELRLLGVLGLGGFLFLSRQVELSHQSWSGQQFPA